MEDIEQTTVLVRNAIRDIPKTYDRNSERINKLDLETQDLLHTIELGKIDAILRQELFRQLREVRQERRMLKDENELLAPIVDILAGMKNKIPQLDQSLGKIRKVKMTQGQRKYTFRVRKDLEKVLTL